MRINIRKGVRKIELTKREYVVLEEAKGLLVELGKQDESNLSNSADIAADFIGQVVAELMGEPTVVEA